MRRSTAGKDASSANAGSLTRRSLWTLIAQSIQIALLLLTPGLASAQASHPTYIAPTNETVTTTTRLAQNFGGSPYKEIWVQNASTVPVRVYTVTLSSCVNVREECGQADSVHVHLAPGDRKFLHRVDPCDGELKFSFQYTMEWRADSLSHK